MTARTVTTADAREDFDSVLASLKDGPVSITRGGVVVAVLAPAKPSSFGCMAREAKVLGDIVGPDLTEDWGRLG